MSHASYPGPGGPRNPYDYPRQRDPQSANTPQHTADTYRGAYQYALSPQDDLTLAPLWTGDSGGGSAYPPEGSSSAPAHSGEQFLQWDTPMTIDNAMDVAPEGGKKNNRRHVRALLEKLADKVIFHKDTSETLGNASDINTALMVSILEQYKDADATLDRYGHPTADSYSLPELKDRFLVISTAPRVFAEPEGSKRLLLAQGYANARDIPTYVSIYEIEGSRERRQGRK